MAVGVGGEQCVERRGSSGDQALGGGMHPGHESLPPLKLLFEIAAGEMEHGRPAMAAGARLR